MTPEGFVDCAISVDREYGAPVFLDPKGNLRWLKEAEGLPSYYRYVHQEGTELVEKDFPVGYMCPDGTVRKPHATDLGKSRARFVRFRKAKVDTDESG